MADYDGLSDLIARVEGAEGPALVLDGEIWCVANGYEFVKWDGSGCVYREVRGAGIRHADASTVRPYTASLDAAVALAGRVLPGWTYGMEMFPSDEIFNPSGAQAFVSKDRSVLDAGYGHGEAKTPAIALVLAILRAVQAQREAA